MVNKYKTTSLILVVFLLYYIFRKVKKNFIGIGYNNCVKYGGKFMLGLYDVRKKNKNADNTMIERYNEISFLHREDIYSFLGSSPDGVSEEIAEEILKINGANEVVKNKKRSRVYFLINSFKDKFILILLFLAMVNFLLADRLGAYIIVGIAILSALIRYFQDYNVYKFNRELKEKLYTTTHIRRKEDKEIRVEEVVIGDVVYLNAGSMVPADAVLLESKDLFVNQSVFTGESVPVEKFASLDMVEESEEIFSLPRICLMGSSVISGRAKAIVINTGANTYLGKMSKEISNKKEATSFEKGIDQVTKLLIGYMVVVSVLVFGIYGVVRRDWLEAILFALSVAVGITPSMLPMIINVNLTRGTKVLAKKKTLVKNINSIQNLGGIDVLCTDKTGTLTEDRIILQKYIDVHGKEDKSILEYAYLNSYFATGIKNLVDRAIISYAQENNVEYVKDKYTKIDEIPFDYVRKIMSVVVQEKNKKNYRMLSKGAIEEILKVCTKVKYEGKVVELTDDLKELVSRKAQEFAVLGMQVIALAAKKEYRGVNAFSTSDEKDMTFIGFVAFLDPPKKDVKETLENLKSIGVSTKIITGDNPFATSSICELVGIDNTNLLVGTDVDKLSDEELAKKIEEVSVFARMNPLQKERVVKAYKKNGHIVGYMGDGVNDAPSLHVSDVGICVNTATDIAKEAADIILLEKDLDVIYHGVREGRRVYGNIMKYMKMALSADFGDVFSIVISSIFLPFLPLLPIQMLLQDFLYDISQIAIPYDDVDEDFLEKPKKWSVRGIGDFMNIMGAASSLIDVVAFAGFWYLFGFRTESFFQTAWFVECLISETMIIHYIRTAKKPFIESRANIFLTLGTLITIVGTILTPLLLHSIDSFHFEILPVSYYGFVLALLVLYSVIVHYVKKWYIKYKGEWL